MARHRSALSAVTSVSEAASVGLPTVAHALDPTVRTLACQPQLTQFDPRVSEGWCARQDSNLRPTAPEAVALSS
jgi:hypothetical protein